MSSAKHKALGETLRRRDNFEYALQKQKQPLNPKHERELYKSSGYFIHKNVAWYHFFLCRALGKIFTYTVPKVYNMFFKDFETTFLPKWLIWATAYYTSYVEMIGGFLLIIGLFKKYAMYLLAVALLIVSFGHKNRSGI